MQMEQSQQQRYCLSFLISKLRQQAAGSARGEAMRGEAGSRQPTTDKQLPGAAAIFARLSWLPGRRVRAAAAPSLSPPEWLLIKNKHDFCFAFIFYYKPASPAPTRPALPCPAQHQHQPHLPFSRPGLLEKR